MSSYLFYTFSKKLDKLFPNDDKKIFIVLTFVFVFTQSLLACPTRPVLTQQITNYLIKKTNKKLKELQIQQLIVIFKVLD